MTPDLTGKKALVTGGARGIGLASVEALAGAGAAVTFTARNDASIEKALSELPADVIVKGVVADATDLGAVSAVASQGFDILINNAGVIGPIGRISDVDISEFARNHEINITGAFHVIQQVLDHMVKNGGTIVNLSSGAAHNPMEGWSAYCSSKAALKMLTACVDKEFGEKGVRAFGFAPGVVDTGMQGSIRESGINPVSQLKRSDLAPATEPAAAMVWLCGDESGDLAGQEIDVRDPALRARMGLEEVA